MNGVRIAMEPFVGSAVVFKNDGYYIAFTPKENGTVVKYDSETNEPILIHTNGLKYSSK
jgi:hypothetical protein